MRIIKTICDCEPEKETDGFIFYDGSVYLDIIVKNDRNRGLVVTDTFRNMLIRDSVTSVIHPNLYKRRPYQCTPHEKSESSGTDLVISRDATSVRFGERNYMSSKGRVLISRGASVEFKEGIEDGLGLHFAIETNDGVVIYTQKDDPDISSRGVLVMAPNFTRALDGEYNPVLGMKKRSGYTELKPDKSAGGRIIENIQVEGSMIINYYINLDKYATNSPGGWFSGQHSGEWFQPPNKAVTLNEQAGKLDIVQPGDLVISRGTASVVLRSDGGVVTTGPVAVLLLPVGCGDNHDVKTTVVFQ